MYIYNIDKKEILENIVQNWFNEEFNYFILCSPCEIQFFKEDLNLDDSTVDDCLNFDDIVRFESFDEYDFISLNSFKHEGNKIEIEEINFYIGYNFIILVVDENNSLSLDMKNILNNKVHIQSTSKMTLSRLYYLLFNSIIINTFDILDKIEDEIQNLEDEIIKNTKKDQFSLINHMRHKTRKIVKYIRPLLYIGDQFTEENLRYLNSSNLNRSNLNRLQSIDIRINKLYDFSISLKDYSDKLLSLYDSGITSKTNDIATKIALFTGIIGSMTVITGIYGMNFKYMPELNWIYGYPFVLTVMVFISIGAFLVFKKKKWL